MLITQELRDAKRLTALTFDVLEIARSKVMTPALELKWFAYRGTRSNTLAHLIHDQYTD